MNKIPKLFKNKNINPIDHNKKQVYVKEDNTSIEETLNNIFNGIGNPFNTKVLLKTKNTTKETYIAFKTNKSITTLDNEVIPIKDILYLEVK